MMQNPSKDKQDNKVDDKTKPTDTEKKAVPSTETPKQEAKASVDKN